ncbi:MULTISPECIES: class I SAM-dependent methyltransferase [Micromonospora]|uniref:class I SAM-dependent methyltransferase n=1 Tax=Micromonospora TaxID=1873 RepID=UPI0018F2866E|nr:MULTISPECIES: methyltransferase domain-containing protein [Micromonospora]
MDDRLAALYDAENPWGRDDEFFLRLAAETPAARVVDPGCGTGRLTPGPGRRRPPVTGVEPARAALDAARAKPGAGQVTWIEGTAEELPDAAFDLALLTSHVAQEIRGDDEWAGALADLRRALLDGALAYCPTTCSPAGRHCAAPARCGSAPRRSCGSPRRSLPSPSTGCTAAGPASRSGRATTAS